MQVGARSISGPFPPRELRNTRLPPKRQMQTEGLPPCHWQGGQLRASGSYCRGTSRCPFCSKKSCQSGKHNFRSRQFSLNSRYLTSVRIGAPSSQRRLLIFTESYFHNVTQMGNENKFSVSIDGQSLPLEQHLPTSAST